MEPKYLAFRRWLYTPCSSSDVRWARIPRESEFLQKSIEPTFRTMELVKKKLQKKSHILRGQSRRCAASSSKSTNVLTPGRQRHEKKTKSKHSWQFFVTFLVWLSDPFQWSSDLQLGDEKVTNWITWMATRSCLIFCKSNWTIITRWCSTPTLLRPFCSSFMQENGHPLLICSSRSAPARMKFTSKLVAQNLLHSPNITWKLKMMLSKMGISYSFWILLVPFWGVTMLNFGRVTNHAS